MIGTRNVMFEDATPISTNKKLLPGLNTQGMVDSNRLDESQTLTTANFEALDCIEPCSFLEETNLTHGNTTFGCDEQRIHMTLVYTFAAVSYGITAVFIGISLDFLGIRTTRAVGSTFSCLGFLCLANITPDASYLLWPGLILIALGTNQLRFSGFLFADLWPEYRATILTAYSSAYAVSTTFFLGLQILYEWHVRMDLMCFLSAGGCVITFIPTLFISSSSHGDESLKNEHPSQNQEEGDENQENNNFLNKSHEDIQDDVEHNSTNAFSNKPEDVSDPVMRLAYKMQAPTFAMAGATVLLALTMTCKIFVNEVAIYASLILIALARPTVIGSCTSYIRLRFPSEHFNILNGVFTTIISVLCFVQHPVMKWMSSSNDAFRFVQILLLISLILSLASPCHMMIRKNIMGYARERLYGTKK
ncbi:Large neutral amino acids transporter small subunit 3 [Orchesella cincta]|uniref:Large neutral amino acids transporter small subunit 3 n=1 Tax=Orchesella cincta TaxID=48709 RepID=A0A1D2N4I2_ORCCI|nr:Large neutral amino acids transporter small subunit 3 [Orchesella cincta]